MQHLRYTCEVSTSKPIRRCWHGIMCMHKNARFFHKDIEPIFVLIVTWQCKILTCKKASFTRQSCHFFKDCIWTKYFAHISFRLSLYLKKMLKNHFQTIFLFSCLILTLWKIFKIQIMKYFKILIFQNIKFEICAKLKTESFNTSNGMV